MSDRFSGLVVILADDVREDDAQPLISAIGQLRGVQNVLPVTSRPGLEMVVKQRIRDRMHRVLVQALFSEEVAE
jgi:hypothetical protein